MPRLLNERHEAFCQAYVRGPAAGNLTKAHAAAGYRRNRSNASRLAEEPLIRARIAELRRDDAAIEREANERAKERIMAALAIDKQAVRDSLVGAAFGNAADFLTVDDDGHLALDLTRVTREQAAALQCLDVGYVDGPDGKQRVKHLRLRLWDKRQTLSDVAQHFGAVVLQPSNGVSRPAAPSVTVARTSDDDAVICRQDAVIADLPHDQGVNCGQDAVIADVPRDQVVNCRQDAVMDAGSPAVEPDAGDQAVICRQDAVMDPGAPVGERDTGNQAVSCRQNAVIADAPDDSGVNCGQDAVMQRGAADGPPLTPPEKPPSEDPNARPLPPVTWLGDLLYNSGEGGP
jgi:phage terminase small subunit